MGEKYDRIILKDNTKILFTHSDSKQLGEMYFYFYTDKTEEQIRKVLTKENLSYLRICNYKDRVYGKYYDMYCRKVETNADGIICASILPIPKPSVPVK